MKWLIIPIVNWKSENYEQQRLLVQQWSLAKHKEEIKSHRKRQDPSNNCHNWESADDCRLFFTDYRDGKFMKIANCLVV